MSGLQRIAKAYGSMIVQGKRWAVVKESLTAQPTEERGCQ